MNSKEQSTAQLEQAGLWWLRLREDDVRPEEISEWLAWCQRDPANLEAFEKIEGMGVRFDHLDAATRDELLRDVLAETPVATNAVNAVSAIAPYRRRRWPAFALAAGVAAVAVTVGFFVQRAAPLPAINQVAVYTTAKAELQDVKLADGSQVAIGAATRLDVAYSAGLRRLSLGDGEAYFEVAHNPQRPFVVHVGGLRVTAVGTAFNIRKTGGRVEVVVTKGVVDVAGDANHAAESQAPSPHLPGSGVIRVPAGQLVVSENQRLTVTPADGDDATAWRRGSQRFVDEDLSVVVANLNRYAHDEVVIADPKLAQLRYTGTVLEGHEREWLAAIEKVFPVTVQHEASGRVILRHRARADRGTLRAS